jgi:ribA/ribD-fused uncharacterized protein
MPETIKEFKGRNSYLSNFSASTIRFLGRQYPTVEHAFQSFKTHNPDQRQAILNAPDAYEAKQLGKICDIRPDWDDIRDDVMLQLVRAKFFQHQELAVRLLNTGDALLQEGNTWDDTYWGVDAKTGEGQNRLGEILMQVRDELRHLSRKD